MAQPATPRRSRRAPSVAPDPFLRLNRRVLAEVLGPPEARRVRVEYWQAGADPPDDAPVTLRLNWPGALRRMLLPPTDLSVGEAYVRGEIDFVGDLEAAVRAGMDRVEAIGGIRGAARLFRLLRRLPRRVSDRALAVGDGPAASGPRAFERRRAWRVTGKRKDALAVRFHYDLGNEFFRLFLDERMQYSCAYFARPDMELEEAQEAKLDLICRKLCLRPGERLLDVGCGWGGLVVLAAQRYGVHVTGITLSQAQAEWARREVARAGLDDRCRIEIRDYRTLSSDERFDKAASVGMIEHVGLARYPDYFGSVFRALRPGGLFLNHGIVHLGRGHSRLDRLRVRAGRSRSFIHRYIFPGSDLVPLGRTLVEAERAGFETRDVESLREHYARTLRVWVQRLERRWNEAVDAVGEPTARAWRFYMAASAHLFSSGRIGIVQSLLAKPGEGGTVELPATRAALYD